MSFNHGLNPGDILDNNQLCSIFQCTPYMGMRRSLRTNTLVLVSDHTKSLYDDRWVGDIFQYTGMGKSGDQSLDYSQNKTLYESSTNGIEVYLFEVFLETQYIFRGQVKLAGKPFQEIQIGEDKILRKAWVFQLELVDRSNTYQINEELLRNVQEIQKKKATKLTDDELKLRAQNSRSGQSKREAIITTIDRDAYIIEYAKRRAKGICQLCEKPAPFKSKNGEPYLETHHIEWLSRGGPDTIENTVALCPNCHKKMHIVENPQDMAKLKQKAIS